MCQTFKNMIAELVECLIHNDAWALILLFLTMLALIAIMCMRVSSSLGEHNKRPP